MIGLVVALAIAAQIEVGNTVWNLKTASQLAADCSATPVAGNSLSMVRSMSCIAYISGVIDAMETGAALGSSRRTSCFPRGAIADDAVQAVKRELKLYPSQAAASVVVMQTLSDHYACERG